MKRPGTVLVSLHRKKVAHLAVDFFTVLLFAGALLAPLVDQSVRPVDEREPRNENRSTRPNPKSPHDLVELNAFPSAFEAHHADTFGLRDVLLHWNSVLKTSVFKESPTPIVVLDRSGWVDYVGEHTLDVLRGMYPLAQVDLDRWAHYLSLARGFCSRNGAKYLFVACPNKETIYWDHVPSRYEPLGPTRLDQIVARLPEVLLSSFLDLRPMLLAARADDSPPGNLLYYPNGTHWNGRGGWVAYKAVMSTLAREFPAMHVLSEADIEWQLSPNSDGDSWGGRLYQPDRFRGDVYACVVKGPRRWHEIESDVSHGLWHTQNPSVEGPRVLVIGDSFGGSFWTLFANTFPDVDFVKSDFDPGLVKSLHPDIVIEVRVERTFVIRPLVSAEAEETMSSKDPKAGEGSLALSVDAAPAAYGSEPFLVTGGAHVERKEDGISFTAETIRSGWELPAFELAATDRAWLNVEIESDKPGTLLAYRRDGKDGPWLRRESVMLPYAAGRHVLGAPLPGPPGHRQILLRLRGTPAQVTLRHLEVRTSGI